MRTAALAALVLVAGCDVLDPDPPFPTTANYYQTEDQIELAVVGLYSTPRDLHNTLQWAFGEMRSDNTSFQFNAADRGGSDFEAIDEFTMSADNGAIAGYWNTAYNGIAQANYVLRSIDDVSFGDEARRGARKAEALFMRAWLHFQLVRLYGDVPLVLETLTARDEAVARQRDPVDVVYTEGVIPDLDQAVALLQGFSQTDPGRITEGAARTLLADVHMTRRDWAAAVAQLEAVTRLGYALEADYADVFDPANKNGPESIWEVQYTANPELGQASGFTKRFAPFNSGRDVISNPNAPVAVSTQSGRNQPTDDLIEAYEEGDLRFPVSVGVYEDGDAAFDDETTAEPYVNKYNFGLNDTGQEDTNWPVYRYGGVLLMLAESLVEAGRAGEAQPYLDAVRGRAGLAPVPATREAIRDERRVELAFENQRWFDLLRWGTAEERMRAHGEQQKAEKGVQPTGAVAPGAYTTVRTLLAIPAGQVMTYGYRQNPGW